MPLNLFPSRSAIGVVVDETGKKFDVYMTVEFSRALSDLLERVGGDDGTSSSDIESIAVEALFATPAPAPEFPDTVPVPPMEYAAMQKEIIELRKMVQQLFALTAATPAPPFDTTVLEQISYAMAGSAVGINWERPGRIGRVKPNTGDFTVLSTGAGTVGLPSFYLGSDTTSGLYRIGANNIGVSISGTKRLDISSSGLGVVGNVNVTGVYVQTGVATSGSGGQTRYVADTGTLQWVAGLLGSAGAVDYTIYDTVSGAPRLTIAASGGIVTAGVGFTTPGVVTGSQIRSTITSGSPPFIIASGDLVAGLHADICDAFSGTGASSYAADATDLATVITLANDIKAKLIARKV